MRPTRARMPIAHPSSSSQRWVIEPNIVCATPLPPFPPLVTLVQVHVQHVAKIAQSPAFGGAPPSEGRQYDEQGQGAEYGQV